MDFIISCKRSLHQFSERAEFTVKDFDVFVTELCNEWEDIKQDTTSTDTTSAASSDLAAILNTLHVICSDSGLSVNERIPQSICQLLESLLTCTLQMSPKEKPLSAVLQQWVQVLNLHIVDSAESDESVKDTALRVILCQEMALLLVDIVSKSQTVNTLNLHFSKMVDMMVNTMQLLTQYDIQRVYSLLYYGNILWTAEFDYRHPKCEGTMNLEKAKEMVASFHFILFHLSSYFESLLRLLVDHRMRDRIFTDLSTDFRSFSKLQNLNGFTIPKQLELQRVILQFIRYCRFYEQLTDNEWNVIDRGQNINMNLKQKLQTRALSKMLYQIDSQAIRSRLYTVRSAVEQLLRPKTEDDGSCWMLSYLVPIWRRELTECHKRPTVNKKKQKSADSRHVAVGNRSTSQWHYYQKYASNRQRDAEKEEDLMQKWGDCWEYLHFSTRFEIHWVLHRDLKEQPFSSQVTEDMICSLLKILRNYRDYQKRFALQSLSTLSALKYCGPALQQSAPVVLDTLRLALAYREDVITEALYPLIISVLDRVLTISDQVSMWRVEQGDGEKGQTMLRMQSAEGIFERINGDAMTLMHSGGNADLLRKRMILNYYLAQFRREKVLNVKRWHIVFDIVLKFMVDTDDLDIVSLCFEYIDDAIQWCWMTVSSYHAKIVLFVAKLVIKLDRFKRKSRSHIDCMLVQHQSEVLKLCENVVISLLRVCQSDQERKRFLERLTAMQKMKCLFTFVQGIFANIDVEIED